MNREHSGDNVYMVSQMFPDGAVAMFTFVKHANGNLYVPNITTTGYIPVEELKFLHDGKLWRIPLAWYRGTKDNYNSAFVYNQTNREAIQCSNLEYLEYMLDKQPKSPNV